LLPPPVGSQVLTLGYPLTEIRSKNGLLKIDLKFVSQQGRVTDVYEMRRDRGMYHFPCFRIDQPVNHGFSCGPVFSENRLCGIVSGGSDSDTYVASLWPLCMLEYEYRDMATLGGKRTFADLFNTGELRSQDWPRINDRIEKRRDEEDKPFAYIHS